MLRDKMQCVIDAVNSEVVEREELVHAIALALLSGNNLFILGAPGQAKSYAINAFRARIEGAKQFERLLSKQCDEEALFGRLDLASLIPGGVPKHVLDADSTYQTMKQALANAIDACRSDPNNPVLASAMRQITEKLEAYSQGLAVLHGGEPATITTGKIPDAHLVFLDEIFKANDGILNSLLTALNEKRYTNEGVTVSIPAISFFSASNEIPNFKSKEEQILEPLHDRFQLKVKTENVRERDARLSMLKRKQLGGGASAPATFTLTELYEMQREVQGVSIPDAINELMDDVLCELRRKQVTVSDRKYFNYGPIAQAQAWLNGHNSVAPTDLLALRNYLWSTPQEIEPVTQVLELLCANPLRTRLDSLLGDVRERYNAFNGVPADQRQRALVHFRAELVRLYREWLSIERDAQNSNDGEMVQDALAAMEDMSRQAHESMGFTHMPLDQLAALQPTA